VAPQKGAGVRSDESRYGAALAPGNDDGAPIAVENAADLFAQTVDVLVRRVPSIGAAAAAELDTTTLALHFGDGSDATLSAHLNSLVVTQTRTTAAVECFFNDQSLILLYDLERRPCQVLQAGAFDVRGPTDQVLAVWRTFQLLAQRAAGLRPVQALWTAYRRGRHLDFNVPARNRAHHPGPAADVPDAAASLRDGEQRAEPSASVATTRVLWDRRVGQGWWAFDGPQDADLFEIM
jgi:geranylgeranyl diphosphate synthase, type II